MEKVEIGEPEKLLKEIDFSKVVPDKDKTLKIGSKVYILSHGMISEEFYLSDIKGDLNGVDQSPEDVRKQMNVYSETELENIKRSFLKSGYLEQENGSSAYTISGLGVTLYLTYVQLFRCFQISKEIEYLEVEKNLTALNDVVDIGEDTSDLSQDMKEEIIQKMEKDKEYSPPFVDEKRFSNTRKGSQIKTRIMEFINGVYDVKDNIRLLKFQAQHRSEMSREEIHEIEELLEILLDKDFTPDLLHRLEND